jgi:hypothetical protein
MIDLAALPAWEVRRPREWSMLEASSSRLLALSAVSSNSDGAPPL